MKKFQKKTLLPFLLFQKKKKTQNQNQNQNQLQADKGSAGVEMNQCNAEISFNKFAYGKSEKGGGLYLQGVGALLTRNFFFDTFSESRFFFSLFCLIKTPKLTLSFLSPSISKTPPPPPSVGDIKGCVFENNAATFGGGVFRGSSTGNLVDSTFKGNRAKSFGGGLYDSHVSGDVAGCKFSGNRAARGAALFRTESKGDSGDNKGVDDETAVVDNPAV